MPWGTAPSRDPNKPFLSDIQEFHRRARQHIEKGAATEDNQADLETAIRPLNEAVASQIVCVVRATRVITTWPVAFLPNPWRRNFSNMLTKSRATPTESRNASSSSREHPTSARTLAHAQPLRVRRR
jgi:hypothetical protein